MAVFAGQRRGCAAEAAPARAVRAHSAAHERRARRAQVRGYGMSGDAHHITQPPEDGGGAALAVRRALADGALRPADVAYVNAHATGARASRRPGCVPSALGVRRLA
jgi:3-oxoacyl-(acyl-carrier-protein) synthase